MELLQISPAKNTFKVRKQTRTCRQEKIKEKEKKNMNQA